MTEAVQETLRLRQEALECREGHGSCSPEARESKGSVSGVQGQYFPAWGKETSFLHPSSLVPLARMVSPTWKVGLLQLGHSASDTNLLCKHPQRHTWGVSLPPPCFVCETGSPSVDQVGRRLRSCCLCLWAAGTAGVPPSSWLCVKFVLFRGLIQL